MISDHSTVGTAALSPVRSKGVPTRSFIIWRAKYKLQRYWWYYPTELQRLDFREECTTNCFPSIFPEGEIFQASDKKGRKVFITSKKENPFFIRCSLYLYACVAQKLKWENINYLRCSIINIIFPKLYCQYWGNLKRVKKQVKINNAVFKVKLL